MNNHVAIIGIRAALFGGCRLSQSDGTEFYVASRKGRALIVYLLCAPGMSASRDKVADLFWPDADSERARNNLRQTLSTLKAQLPPGSAGLLASRGDEIALSPGLISSDLTDFEVLVGRGDSDSLEAAMDLFNGPFLDGFYSGADGFDKWAAAEREALTSRIIAHMEKVARKVPAEKALKLARRILLIDPTREASYRLEMELLVANGRRDQAYKTYDQCLAMLKQEYGVGPSPETRHLLKTILADTVAVLPVEPSFGTGQANTDSRKPTVEITPFASLSQTGAEAHVAGGFQHDITSALSRERLSVILGQPGNSKAGGSQDGLRFSLSGGVQIVGFHVRLNVTLTDTATGHTVWAERFDGKSDDLLSFQDTVAMAVTYAVRIELQLHSWNVSDKSPPGGNEVRKLINQALTKYFLMTRESLRESIALCDEALAIEPYNPRAIRTMSIAISMSMAFGAITVSPDNVMRALDCARFAVNAVPEDEIARTYLAFAMLFEGRNKEAITELHHAIELNPDYPNSHGDVAEHYALMGNTADALRYADAALDTKSLDPIAFWRHHYVALAKFAAGDDAGALESARRVVNLKPGFVRGALYWAASAAAMGKSDEAHRAIQHCLSFMPDLRVSNVAPGFVPRYENEAHHQRFLTMLRRAGMPE